MSAPTGTDLLRRALTVAVAVGLSGLLATGVGALVSGCGTPAARAQAAPGTPAEVADTLQRLDARVSELSSEVEDLRERLAVAEGRVGLRAPAPVDTQPWTVAGRLALPKKLNLLTKHGAAPVQAAPDTGAPGAAYVISFWATWCKPCTTPEELDLIRHLQRELRSEGLGLFNLAVDDLGKVRGDARAPTWVYPVWQADDGHIEVLPEAFIKKSGLGLPLFLVVDGGGKPRYWRNKKLDAAGVGELVALARSL